MMDSRICISRYIAATGTNSSEASAPKIAAPVIVMRLIDFVLAINETTLNAMKQIVRDKRV